jgi:hypothetical protein
VIQPPTCRVSSPVTLISETHMQSFGRDAGPVQLVSESGINGDQGRYLLSWLLDEIDLILHVQCMHMPSEMGSAGTGAMGRVLDGPLLSMSCPFPVPHACKWVRKASTSAATATTVCAICRSLVGCGGRIEIHVQDARGRNSKCSSLLTA